MNVLNISDISDQWKKSQDTPKKVAEERQSSSSIERKNVFDEGLGDSDYINIFYNCLKNL